MDFFTMGMFILDDIVSIDKTKVKDIIGGAGIYAAQSAGLFLSANDRFKASMIIDTGSDFPSDVRKIIDSWNLGIIWREHTNRLTTRGLNTYLDNEERDFEYLTPKIRIEASDITNSLQISQSKSLHLICSPLRCLEICTHQRASVPSSTQLFIWEPVPFDCFPHEWENCKKMFEIAHVISPNAKEAAGFLGQDEPTTKQEIEAVADHYSDFKGIFIIRCGVLGCLLVYKDTKTWYRPYHLNADKVVDPTGGGNSFLGGVSIALAHNLSVETAIVYGTVAAGIQIEQIGPAKYDSRQDVWNGTKISTRVKDYARREDIVVDTMALA